MTNTRKRNVVQAVLTVVLLCGGLCSSLAATGPVAHWKFDENSGSSAADASGNNNTGTLTDMDTSTCWEDGRVNTALHFDGAEDYVSVPHSSSLNISGSEVSVEAWVKIDNITPMYHIVACKGSYTYLFGTCGDAVTLLIGKPGGYSWNTLTYGQTRLETSKWYHIAGTYKNGIGKVYVNGVLDGSSSGEAENVRTNTSSLSIGSADSYTSSYYFDGLIDEVKIYDRQLLPIEMKESFNCGKWRFAEGYGSTTADDSSYGNTGTLTNMDIPACWVDGRADSALAFDGTEDYVDCGNDSLFNFNHTNNFTISFWMKPDGLSNYQGVVGKWSGGWAGSPYQIVAMTNGRLRIGIGNGTASDYIEIPAENFAVGQWTYVAFTYDGSILCGYANGAKKASKQIDYTLTSTTNSLRIGMYAANYFDGVLDEVNVYDQSLSELDIRQRYYAVDLCAEWSFDEKFGTSLSDISGNSNTGTLINMDSSHCWVDGRIGHALTFDGTEDYVSIPHSSSLNITGSEVSVEAWVKPDTRPSYHIIACKGSYSYFLSVFGGRATLLMGYPDTYAWNTLTYGQTVLDASKWYHIVGTYKDGVGKVYVNGVLDGTDTGDNENIRSSTSTISIGSASSYASTYFFEGTIDQVNIFSRALTAAEIDQRFEDHGGEYGFGCEEQPTGDPIGGGAGYSEIISANDADYVVNDLSGLLGALDSAVSGDIIFIDGSCTIDFTTDKDNDPDFELTIPGGVTLASDRGYNGSSGALLKTDTVIASYNTLFGTEDSGVRLTGLRLQGPQDTVYSGTGTEDYSDGIQSAYSDLEVDNCEISGWGHAGIALLGGGTDAYIHHNYIHNCQRYGLGYGVSHGYGDVTSLIEANKFDYNRHSIAATGTTGNSYEARYNMVLENATLHCFDVHGGQARYPYDTDIAGDNFYIHHNTFEPVNQRAVYILGIPNNEALVYNNWFMGLPPEQWASVGTDLENMDIYMNLRTAERFLVEWTNPDWAP